VASERRDVKVDQWAHFGSIWQHDLGAAIKEVIVTVNGNDKAKISITPRTDTDWPLVDRGLVFEPDVRVHKAEGLGQALALGFRRVSVQTGTMYENLYSLIRGKISPKAMSGPITIARVAFLYASKDEYEFILFIAFININLAVVNFLPIPLLDGGHMMFLHYELVRGKPPSETVRLVLTIIGVSLILSLFAFVTFLDVAKL
jgi:regulator of sigma E protease